MQITNHKLKTQWNKIVLILNPPSKFPNQGVLAFPGAPCEPNFRGLKIGETGSQRRGPLKG
jgi:hypothetical protein